MRIFPSSIHYIPLAKLSISKARKSHKQANEKVSRHVAKPTFQYSLLLFFAFMAILFSRAAKETYCGASSPRLRFPASATLANIEEQQCLTFASLFLSLFFLRIYYFLPSLSKVRYTVGFHSKDAHRNRPSAAMIMTM